MQLVESCLETIDESMRQVRNETYCIHQNCLLPIWKSYLALRSIECLKQTVLRIQLRPTAHVHKSRLTRIRITNESHNWHGVVSILFLPHHVAFFLLMRSEFFANKSLPLIDGKLFHFKLRLSSTANCTCLLPFRTLDFNFSCLLPHQVARKH